VDKVLVWQNGVKVIRPATPDEVVSPMQCSPAQMRVALHRAGLLDQVNAIAATDPEAQIIWEYATVIQRDSPFIDALGLQHFTPEQIDALFIAAQAT
jgi:hypothetical protein